MKRQSGILGEVLNELVPHSLLRSFSKPREAAAALAGNKRPTENPAHLLSLVALHTDNAIIITDPDARIQWVNPAFTRLTGFELDEVIGEKAGRAQQGPESSAETLEAMRVGFAQGEGFNVELLNYARDGQSYWVDIEARPIYGACDELQHFIVTQRVITEQHQQTEQLKQSKLSAEGLASDLASSRQQLRMAADAGGLSLWDWDMANDRFWISSQWLPVANEQWIKECGLWDLFTLALEDDFPLIECSIKRMLEEESFQINEQFRMSIFGKWRWVNFRGAVSARDEQGKPIRVSGTLLDETDRKEAEERAQADRDLLQCVIGHIPHAVFWKDAECRYLGCNRKFAESLGLDSEHEVIGRLDEELRSSPALARAIAASDQRVVDTGQEVIAAQQEITAADGSRRQILCSKVPLRTTNGIVFGMLGVFNDITDQKRLEQDLADARQLESVGRLAAGVAHEINTPMQYISDNVEFLSESTAEIFELIDRVQAQIAELKAAGDSSPAQRRDALASDKRLSFIREQVPKAIKDCLVGSRRVIEIVTAMKVFTHPGKDGFVNANVNDLIVSTTSITRNRWKYCARVDLDLDPDLPLIRCLATEINQVVLNLLINATDAVAERFGATNESLGAIAVSTRRASGGIVFQVTDNGCGIPEANYRRIFDPFFTTKGVGKGTGQGLTLCYGVVCNKHGGTLTVNSKVGEGTTFTVFLPEIPCPVTDVAEPIVAPDHVIC